MNRFRSSLRYKIGFWMLLLSLGPLVLVGVITLLVMITQLQTLSARMSETEAALRGDVVGRNLSGQAVDTAAEIDRYMLERIEDVRRWSEEPVIIAAARQGSLSAQQSGLAQIASDPAAVKDRLQGSLFLPIPEEVFSPALSYAFQQIERPSTPFVEIVVSEIHGINVLVTRQVDQVAFGPERWFQTAVRPDLAGIGILPAAMDAMVQKPVVGLALPVIDPNTKEILGSIRALVSLADLQARLSQKSASSLANIRVIGAGGVVIADTASAHSPQVILAQTQNSASALDELAQKVLVASPGVSGAGYEVMVKTSGNEISGYAHTSGRDFYDTPAQLSGFEGFAWGVIVTQPEAQALQVLSRLIDTAQSVVAMPGQLATLFVVITVMAALLSLTGAILTSGQISVPLIDLSRAAQQIQQGDLSTHVTQRSSDEVGILEQAFNQMVDGLRQRERERDIFGRVVTPEVRERLLTGNLELGGETRRVSVLFSDIRNFSTISEQMNPQQVVGFLNEYLTEMTQAIQPQGGYINNFIGDAIVAIFGAPVDQPDKECRAAAAALAMQERLAALNERRVQRGDPPIRSGIGISTGDAVAGQIGSLDRLLYTVIGDAVNVASRLETLTKETSYSILMNEETAARLEQDCGFSLARLGPTQVKGRSEPVIVYALTGRLPAKEEAGPSA